MPDIFTITPSGNSTTIALDTARQGAITFVVTNGSGRALRARGYVVNDNTSSPDWFAVVGESVRDMPANATEQYQVSIAVPAEKPPGTYSFHFSVVGVENPDEFFGQGPEMSFVVKAAPVRPPVKKGYVEAAIGGLVGALAGGALGFMPGLIFILTTGQVSDLGEFFANILGFALLAAAGACLGIWFGSGLGVWGVLRMRKFEYPGTSGVLAAIFTLIFVFAAALLNGLINAQGILQSILSIILLSIAVAGAALAGRAVTLLLRARQV